jgi:hypothetical protein
MNELHNKKIKTSRQISNREILLQVYFPLGLVVIVFLFISVLISMSATSGSDNVHHWANISFLFVSIPIILMSTLFSIILVAIIYGQAKLIRWLPIQIKYLYTWILRISLWVWNLTQKITQPSIKLKSNLYGISQGLQNTQNKKDK